MNDQTDAARAWFEGVEPDELAQQKAAIRDRTADRPGVWPETAVERGFVESAEEYYEQLHRATVAAAREAVDEREGADDQQLIHSVRALDDCQRTVNELTERVGEWAKSRDPDGAVDIEYLRELAGREPADPIEERLVALATRVVELEAEGQELRTLVEQSADAVAPNLTALAGPELTARLLALAGGLEALAKKPAGTIQVLGAEDALFAHLRGGAPSPKHGVIFTHEFVRGTPPANRGTAARALAGKLAIAARIDYYSGEYRPELEADLAERMERIRAREEK